VSSGRGADASSLEVPSSYMGTDHGSNSDEMEQDEAADAYIYEIFVSKTGFQISDLDKAATCGHDLSCLSKHLEAIKSETQALRD